MKKILLSVFLATALGSYFNQADAQCNGANVLVTNVQFNSSATHHRYQFNWQFIQGNASLQAIFRCNGVDVAFGPCLPFLKDSSAGTHFFRDSFAIAAVGCEQPTDVREIVIVIWASNQCNGTYCEVSSEAPLPVSFVSFNATRSASNVNISWSTASEQNNNGFAIERNIGGVWSEVAFVPTQAQFGNSDVLLNYAFTDLNTTKGITQYRIKQLDFNGKSKYSEIRSVRGDGQDVKLTVYPNPTSDGKVNIAFDDQKGVRNVSVLDMSGRTVRQMNGITNNNITIENLMPGMYTIRVTVPETGAQAVEKIIVNKR